MKKYTIFQQTKVNGKWVTVSFNHGHTDNRDEADAMATALTDRLGVNRGFVYTHK